MNESLSSSAVKSALLQFEFLADPFWGMLTALLILGGIGAGLYAWTSRVRRLQIEHLDRILVIQPSISIEVLSRTLHKKGLDMSAMKSVIKASRNAILSYSGSTVISAPLLTDRLRSQLMESGSVHVSGESSRWDLTESEIVEIVEAVCRSEGLDVVRTEDGDFILVPELKDRLKEFLELHGRIDVTSESQRIRVKRDELVRLVMTWGWNLVETRLGQLVSYNWLQRALEKGIEQEGFLAPESLATRLDLDSRDIHNSIRRFGWKMIETTDGRLVPAHLLEGDIIEKIMAEGILELDKETERLHVGESEILRHIRKAGHQFVRTDYGSVVLLTYLTDRIKEDLALSGMVIADETAKALGVSATLIKQLIGQIPGLRKGSDGRYISLQEFRRWLLDSIKESGFIRANEVEETWSLAGIQLRMLLERFGLKTVATPSGDHLSLTWIRKRIESQVAKGELVDPGTLAKEFEIEVRVAEAILSQVQVDAFIDGEGALIPAQKIEQEMRAIFAKKGVLDPPQIAEERGLDVADLERLVDRMHLDALKSARGKLVAPRVMVQLMKQTLTKKGVFDFDATARGLALVPEEVLGVIQPHVGDNEFVVEEAGVIVDGIWVEGLRDYAQEERVIRVTSFARERGLRRNATLSLLRRYLKGAYVPRSDVYVVRKESVT
ncbi:MAG: hypothetical protein JSW61_15285 [Candidatus Thorarchaeota archaeon]|nr:MAG: hypothetical protein JSW61_15285 [Candidatus Thorarchaeota archaeon]